MPVCVAALEAGKHAATEVPAAVTLDECWQLVEAAEKSGKQCTMLENYCYFRKAMVILNMVRQGVFGELLHCEGRSQENWIWENWHLFNSEGTLGWVAEHLAKRNGNLYPTHGFGPMAIWLQNETDQNIRTVAVTHRTGAGDWESKVECSIALPWWVTFYNRETRTPGPPTWDAMEVLRRGKRLGGLQHLLPPYVRRWPLRPLRKRPALGRLSGLDRGNGGFDKPA